MSRSFALVLLAVAAPAPAADPAWQWFTPRGGRCAAEMPGKPATQPVKTVKFPGGTAKLHLFLLEAGKETAYGLAYNDFPDADRLTDEAAGQALLAGQTQTTKDMKGTLVADRVFRLGTYPAREYTLELPAGNHYRSRIVLADGRLFQAIVVGPKEFVAGTSARAFLYSLEITPREGD